MKLIRIHPVTSDRKPNSKRLEQEWSFVGPIENEWKIYIDSASKKTYTRPKST